MKKEEVDTYIHTLYIHACSKQCRCSAVGQQRKRTKACPLQSVVTLSLPPHPNQPTLSTSSPFSSNRHFKKTQHSHFFSLFKKKKP
jgi:hypothetical protein